jgi:hypothetical protein
MYPRPWGTRPAGRTRFRGERAFSGKGQCINCHTPPCYTGNLMTFADTVEFFNLVLGVRLNEQEKKDLVAFLRTL